MDDLSIGVSGGSEPYTYSATGLPDWLDLDEDTGMLAGVPIAEAEPTSVTITVTDSSGQSASIEVAIGRINA